MKILIVSYAIWDYDGRTRELYKLFSNFGETFVICRTKEKNLNAYSEKIISFENTSFFTIFSFISLVKSSYSKIMPEIVLFDNRMASLAYFFLKKDFSNSTIIYDARELYISREIKKLKGKLGCWFESKIIKNSNIVLCANDFRKDYMFNEFEITNYPIVFENIRKLDYDLKVTQFDKYKHILDNDKFSIITSNGTSFDRLTDKLVIDIIDNMENVELIITGHIDSKEMEIIKKYAKKNQSISIVFVGIVSSAELSFLISKSKIGVVSYNQKTLNSKFCASGKIYEFLFQRIPVVTSTNPPLKELCEKYSIGEAHDNFAVSIKKIIENYDFYKQNIDAFLDELKNLDSFEKTRKEIKDRLHEISN